MFHISLKQKIEDIEEQLRNWQRLFFSFKPKKSFPSYEKLKPEHSESQAVETKCFMVYQFTFSTLLTFLKTLIISGQL